jgi:hypothetical protein
MCSDYCEKSDTKLMGGDVCSWHVSDMPTLFRNVRSQGQSGKHVLALSFSGFDPNATSSALSTALSQQPSLVGQKHGPDHPIIGRLRLAASSQL